ncbi:MAG: penicillin-binding protein 1C [Cytophagales bacterium]|nr:penicillin-binding protein 1C [Cytophagales bacterium]
MKRYTDNRPLKILPVLILAGFLVFWYYSLPDLTHKDTSSILVSNSGILLSARIAKDEQWRFPFEPNVPEKFSKCLLEFEDSRFYNHHGVDIKSIARAIWSNYKGGRIVSGGSTLTMQLVRLSTKKSDRTILRKVWEMLLALRLELSYSKPEILAYYSNWAPFGRNVVGLSAATWRYYGKTPALLSWGEAAALAVLPNNPSNIYPGRGQELFLRKRNKLLYKLYSHGIIDQLELENALLEPLPGSPLPLPVLADHLIGRSNFYGGQGKIVKSYLNAELQEKLWRLAQSHLTKLSGNGIENAAILVAEVKTGNVLAYIGNATLNNHKENSPAVDLIISPRSTGSILKPLLFGMVLDKGMFLPNALVADIPTIIGDYHPQNHDFTFDGAVPFKQSLSRSLNIPSVRILKDYGTELFHANLKELGFTTLDKPANHYGLSIILGGAEAKLWDICSAYRGIAKRMSTGRESPLDFNLRLFSNLSIPSFQSRFKLSKGAAWEMFDAMNEVNRPDEEVGWKEFNASKIAWKTGTSFGNRDAWAVGVTADYVVGVWVGNADGEGRPELTGITSAAPLLFDAYKLLPRPQWFRFPHELMKSVEVCKYSGFKASENCGQRLTEYVPKSGMDSPFCPYCKALSLSQDLHWQVNSTCESMDKIQRVRWFVLPPVMEYYYKSHSPSYRLTPKIRPDCISKLINSSDFEIIYPENGAKVFIPREGVGKDGQVVVQVACRESESVLFWYLDGTYIGKTRDQHEKSLRPSQGMHKLNIAHPSGQNRTISFEVVN